MAHLSIETCRSKKFKTVNSNNEKDFVNCQFYPNLFVTKIEKSNASYYPRLDFILILESRSVIG